MNCNLRIKNNELIILSNTLRLPERNFGLCETRHAIPIDFALNRQAYLQATPSLSRGNKARRLGLISNTKLHCLGVKKDCAEHQSPNEPQSAHRHSPRQPDPSLPMQSHQQLLIDRLQMDQAPAPQAPSELPD